MPPQEEARNAPHPGSSGFVAPGPDRSPDREEARASQNTRGCLSMGIGVWLWPDMAPLPSPQSTDEFPMLRARASYVLRVDISPLKIVWN